MTQDQLLKEIQHQTAPIIVDVRSTSEYQSGHVPGALHLPFYSLWSRHAEIKGKTEARSFCIVNTDLVPESPNLSFGRWDIPTSST